MNFKYLNKYSLMKWMYTFILFMVLSLCKEEVIISSMLSINSLNFSLIIMTIILMSVSYTKKFNYSNEEEIYKFFFMKIMLMWMCITTFCSEDKMLFFLSFESSIIPMIIMVFMMSKTKEKIEASMYMFIMSISGSIPFLIFVLKENKSNFCLLAENLALEQKKTEDMIFSSMMLIMLLVKVPLFFLHIWLPKAHVEASTMGSMILAGIMLKMGMSGLIKNLDSVQESVKKIKPIIMMMAWVSTLCCMVMSIRSNDIKKMAAISSITHMGMTMNSFLTMKFNGSAGGILMTVTHGLVSSVMFLMMNVGIPPMGSFLSEAFMMISFVSTTKISCTFLAISMMLISSVSMIFITKMIFMKSEKEMSSFKPMPSPILSFIFITMAMNLTIIFSI